VEVVEAHADTPAQPAKREHKKQGENA